MNKKKFIRKQVTIPAIKDMVKYMTEKGISQKEIDEMVYLMMKDIDKVEDKVAKGMK